MSAAAQTKIFGLRIGIDPKILIGGLVAIALVLFWVSSRSSDDTNPSSPAIHTSAPAALPARSHLPPRRTATTGEHAGMLRLRPIDPTRGDIDPTLRLDLLVRLQFVKPAVGERNLFQTGPAPVSPEAALALAKHAPILTPKPLPGSMANAGNTGPVVNIPLKYYGFVRAAGRGENNRGLFLDGDNVLVATEGELLKQRYLVVELKDNSARLEDVQIKQGQTLPVVPVALP